MEPTILSGGITLHVTILCASELFASPPRGLTCPLMEERHLVSQFLFLLLHPHLRQQTSGERKRGGGAYDTFSLNVLRINLHSFDPALR